MYISDPFDLAILPQLEQTEEDLYEEPRDYHEFFWDEAIERGAHTSGYGRLYTQVCRFYNGEHVAMARDCPHFDTEDEEGKRIREGWTAQC